MGSIFGDSAASVARKQQIQSATEEAQREAGITAGTNAINNTFSQFNDDFYNKQAQNYENYATPQLQDQFATANKDLTFSLDNAGMLDSSTRAQQQALLQKQYDTNLTNIQDQANSYENQSKSQIEAARSSLISTLNDTGNAQEAANSAINQAASPSAPPSYSPLADLFSNFTSAFATQAQAEKNAVLYGSQYGGTYKTGLFSVPNATEVTNK